MTTAKIFQEVWDKGDYRRGSTAHRLVSFLRDYLPPCCVINDYGSGTGRADVVLYQDGHRINMVDFADNALEDEARALIGSRMSYTVCALESLPEDFPIGEWGICINVLMTVDPEKLDVILAEMRRTCRNLIVEVYDLDDHRLGRNMTTMKGDAKWWADKLAEFWPRVESVKSPEHARRYITICRS